MPLQLLHEALSDYLVVHDVVISKFDASSSPKEKCRTLSGEENEGAKAILYLYGHAMYQNLSWTLLNTMRLVAM